MRRSASEDHTFLDPTDDRRTTTRSRAASASSRSWTASECACCRFSYVDAGDLRSGMAGTSDLRHAEAIRTPSRAAVGFRSRLQPQLAALLLCRGCSRASRWPPGLRSSPRSGHGASSDLPARPCRGVADVATTNSGRSSARRSSTRRPTGSRFRSTSVSCAEVASKHRRRAKLRRQHWSEVTESARETIRGHLAAPEPAART